ETAAHIKRRPGLRDVPIIFLTAADLDEELAFRSYAAGAVDFITKPFDPRVLRSKVAVFIDLYLLKARELRAAAELSAGWRRSRRPRRGFATCPAWGAP